MTCICTTFHTSLSMTRALPFLVELLGHIVCALLILKVCAKLLFRDVYQFIILEQLRELLFPDNLNVTICYQTR